MSGGRAADLGKGDETENGSAGKNGRLLADQRDRTGV